MANLDELEAAAAETIKLADEAIKIKKIVLLILRSQGIVAFDASEAELSPELESLIKGEG